MIKLKYRYMGKSFEKTFESTESMWEFLKLNFGIEMLFGGDAYLTEFDATDPMTREITKYAGPNIFAKDFDTACALAPAYCRVLGKEISEAFCRGKWRG